MVTIYTAAGEAQEGSVQTRTELPHHRDLLQQGSHPRIANRLLWQVPEGVVSRSEGVPPCWEVARETTGHG